MEPDRATQLFLNRFSESIHLEARRLRDEGAIKQIFGGPMFIQGRVEDGSDVYRITLKKERNGNWQEEVRGPEGNHPAACVAVMLEAEARGEGLPDSPNEIDNLSLTATLEEKLGRELGPEEDRFVDKLEKRYKKYTMEDVLLDIDLVRLNPKWSVESYDPLVLWPTPPVDIIDFWNYIASAFLKKKLTWPKFMDAVTDREGTKNKLEEWENERESEEWQERMQRVLGLDDESESQNVELRVRATTREARLQIRRLNPEPTDDETPLKLGWENVAADMDALKLGMQIVDGTVRVDPLSEMLWTLWTIRKQEGIPTTASLRISDPAAAGQVASLFRQTVLLERVVTLDETPFHRSEAPLRWSHVASEDTEKSSKPGENTAPGYDFQLLMPDGSPVPYDLAVLPGKEPLYMSDDAIFPGPHPWVSGTEIPPRMTLPKAVLESENGLAFLTKLKAQAPAAINELSITLTLMPKLNCRLVKRGGDSEMVHIEVTAADADAYRTEKLERDAWKLHDKQPLPNGKLPIIDRHRLSGISRNLSQFGFAYDGGSGCYRCRLTKNFPDKFVAWLDQLPKDAEIVLDHGLESLKSDPIQAAVRFELAESPDMDWFDLRVLVDVDGEELSKSELRELVAARGGFVRMADGRWMRLSLTLTDEQQEAVTRIGLDVYDLSGEVHRLHALQLADPGAKEIFDELAWERICSRADTLKVQVRPDVPKDLMLTLRPYQVDGFHFLAYLASNRFGGLLADDMGLGKTAQSLTWLLWLRQTWQEKNPEAANIPPVLVVAPKSVLDVWAKEVVKFAPKLRVSVIRVKEDLKVEELGTEVDVLVMNYSQLRVNIEKFSEFNFLAVILDEGQQIKNPDSMAARAARQLKSDHRLVLSGTPIENRLLDMWSLMSFAMPGILGNRKYFRDRFDRRKDPEAQLRLSSRLRPFILRRTKGQVALDLPPRTEEDVHCKMEEAQEELYAAELARMQRLLLGFDSDASLRKNSFAVLQGLMRLRQICCHPALLDPKHDDASSAKMTALFYHLDQLRESGHKVLVFSQFVTMLEIIKRRLEAENRSHHILTGQSKDRGSIVENFQTSKEPDVFLLSLKAGGSGLNLTAASYVVLYDPWWNPAVENQAIDRTHRIGQTNPVIAYRLLIRNSVEEKIRKLQQQKQMLFTGVLGEESFSSNLKLDELQFLFQRE